MRRAVTAVAAACLLLGPTVLAFFSGGFYAEPRLIAAIVVWALVLALALTGPAPLPRTLPGRLALGGLAAMTAWTAISLAWAPLGQPALAAIQRLVLYTGALTLAVGVLRDPRALRAVEPVLAAGATLVIGYGLSGRLLPGMIALDRSTSAGGRLEQPITYWNAEGALAAVGLVLCARVAGDRTRPAWMRMAAAAAAVPLGAGVYLSFSRGAIAVAVLGLIVLVAAARSRTQLRAAALALGAAIVGAARDRAVRRRRVARGSLADRERDGAIALVLLLAAAAVAAALCARMRAREPVDDTLAGAARLGRVALVLGAIAVAGLVIGGLSRAPEREPSSPRGAQRRPPDHGELEPLRVLARRPRRVRRPPARRARRRRVPRPLAAGAQAPRGGARRPLDRARAARRARPRRAARLRAVPRRRRR